MNKSSKSNAALYWVIGVSLASMLAFVYLVVSDAPKTLSKIKLSYFTDESEIAMNVSKRLFQEIGAHQNYWIGIEPGKPEQIEVAAKIKELGMYTFVRWNYIFIAPPLIVTKEQIEEGLAIISEAIKIADEHVL